MSDHASHTVLETIGADRAVALVRVREIPDPVALTSALAAGGIRAVEFAFTTPGVERHIAAARAGRGDGGDVLLGVGTVLTVAQADAAISAGADFLVTPGIAPDVADAAARHGIPVLMGAMTPSEVMRALELRAAAVKVFPAQTVGPAYFRHLSGPFPGVPLIGSGGLNPGNVRAFLEAGAFAVTAGSSVIDQAVVAARDWSAVTDRAREFCAAFDA